MSQISVTPSVTAVTGTANQVTASPTTGAVVVSLPSVLNIPGTETILGAGAASTAQSLWSGVVFTGGTGTTTFPAAFLQPAGTTAVTTWSTAGTGLGMNLAAGFTGNFVDLRMGGGTSQFSIGSAGNIIGATLTLNSSRLIFNTGSQSQTAWTTSGIAIRIPVYTWTDTTSSGTVAAQYINAIKAPTVAASSATTFTNSYNTYFEDPVAGTNVTQTAKWALGADSARFGTVNLATSTVVGSLPAASAANKGTRTFVTDGLAPVFAAIVAGAGAVFTPVYSDGTNWRCG